jgi:hypothetical protein
MLPVLSVSGLLLSLGQGLSLLLLLLQHPACCREISHRLNKSLADQVLLYTPG